jgi:Family of unknown function (DUF6962)
MRLSSSPTELTTAATDAGLGVLCFVLSIWVARMRVTATWKRALWGSVFSLMALGSFLGVAAHGFDPSGSALAAIWEPLYLSIGLAVALFVAGALYDWKGEPTARRALPWLIGSALIFFALTHVLGGAFLVFVVYEATCLLSTLAIYVWLSVNRRLAGARLVTAGIGLSVIAAIVQASNIKTRLIVPYDHNGLFHLVQFAATIVLAMGLGRSFETRASAM